MDILYKNGSALSTETLRNKEASQPPVVLSLTISILSVLHNIILFLSDSVNIDFRSKREVVYFLRPPDFVLKYLLFHDGGLPFLSVLTFEIFSVSRTSHSSSLGA